MQDSFDRQTSFFYSESVFLTERNDKTMKYMRILLLLSLMLSVFGCSGGIESSEVEDRILSLQMFTADSSKTDKITLASSGHLLARLTNTLGTPIPNEIITFKTTLGSIQPATAKTVTDSDGRTSVILLAGQESGAGEVQAIFGEHTASLKFTVESLPGLNLSLKLIGSGGEETRTVSTALPGKLEAVLTYGNNIPIPNQIFQFTTTLGYIQPSSASAVTDENGKAVVQLLAGLESGDGKAAVSFGKYSVETKFTVVSQEIYVTLDLLENTSGVCPPSDPPEKWNKINTVSACSPECLIATVKYLSGNPLTNSVVNFKTDLGGVLPVKGTNPGDIQPGTVQLLETTALTDDKGSAVVYLFAGNKVGAGKVTATVESYPPAQFGFTTLGDQNIFLKLNLFDIPKDESDPKEIREISALSPGNLTAYLMYGCNETPISDQMISFSTSLGTIDPTTATAKTDDKGKASVKLLAGPKPGAGQALAAYGEVKTAPLAFTSLGNGKVTLSLRLIDETSGTDISEIGSNQSGRLEAVLLDANQQPYVGQKIIFSVSDPKLAHTDQETALTDNTGKAALKLMAGSKTGAGTVTATFGDIASTVNFQCNGSGSDPMTLSLQVQDDTGKEMSKIPAGTPARLVATLTRGADKSPVSGITVSFTTDFGTIQPTSQGITNDKGQAAVFIDSKSVGYGTAAAKAEGYSATYTFSFIEPEETKNPILTLQLVSNTTNYVLTDKDAVSAQEPGRVIATLTDENGKPLTGKLITFAASQGVIEPSAITDINGRASVLLQAGSGSGLGKVTASFGTKSSELSFYIK